MKIITKYIFKETLHFFLYTFIVFCSLFFFSNINKIISIVLKNKVSLILIIKLMFLTIPKSFQFIIPMSCVIATLMSLGRLSSDNEIIVMRSCGVKLKTIITPYIIFSIILSMIIFIFINTIIPQSNYNIKKTINASLKQGIDITFRSNSFTNINGYSLYIGKANNSKKELENIIILEYKNKKKQKIIAKSGRWVKIKKSIILFLFNGEIHTTKNEKINQIDIINFPKLKLILNLRKGNTKTILKNEDDMSIFELKKYLKFIKNKKVKINLEIEYYNKISIIFACITLCLIALPIGLTSKKTGKAIGFTYGFLFIIIYFMLLKYLSILSKNIDSIPKYIFIFSPNIILGSIGLFLLKYKTARQI